MTRNTIILGVIGILVLGAAAYMLFGRDKETSAVSGTRASVSEAEQTFINLTAQINPVAFDTRILSDPRFMALQDLKTAILPEASGRIDPFAPLGAAQAR